MRFPRPRRVRLTYYELAMASDVGRRRHIESILKGSTHRVAHEQGEARGWQQNINGACGECCVAKATGRYWGGTTETFKREGDVGRGVEVKTRSRHEDKLIVRPDEPDEAMFWLVTGLAPEWLVWGWMLGGAAKRKEWLEDPNGWGEAYFPPHEALEPLPRPRGWAGCV